MYTTSPAQAGLPRAAQRSELRRVGAPQWAAFFEEHSRFVTRVVRRFGGAHIDLEDAVQDVFLVLFQKLHEFEGRSELRTWIYRICRNVASEHRRRHSVRTRLAELATRLAFWKSTPSTPAETLGARRDWALMEKTLEQLSEKRRETFILCELEQLSGDEAAEVLGVPVATVRTRLFHARKDFHETAQRLRGEE